MRLQLLACSDIAHLVQGYDPSYVQGARKEIISEALVTKTSFVYIFLYINYKP